MLTKIKKIVQAVAVLIILATSVQITQTDTAAAATRVADNCPATAAEAIKLVADKKLSTKEQSNCAVCHPEWSGGSKLSDSQFNSCTECINADLKVSGEVKSGAQYCLQENVIVKRINEIVNVLSAVVGIVVVGTIILGGIQYSLASGKQDATVNAKKRIMNGIIALVAYLLIFGFLQWLVPGGVL